MNVMKTFTAGALALALSMSVAKAADIAPCHFVKVITG
jgi:hypothetical protein